MIIDEHSCEQLADEQEREVNEYLNNKVKEFENDQKKIQEKTS